MHVRTLKWMQYILWITRFKWPNILRWRKIFKYSSGMFFFFTISWVVLCPSLASWLPDPGKMLLDSQRNCYNRDPEIQNALFSLCCYLCSFLFHFQRLVIESNNNVICVPCPQFFVLFLPCIFAFIQVILEFWVQNHLVGQINQITFTKILPLFVVHCSLWSK